MESMPSRRHRSLPPFAALVAFDAILRLESVTRAAEELALTQSAVSHRLRLLERHFGTKLLKRLHPGLEPTAAGARLARALAPILAGLDRLPRDVLQPKGRVPFRIGTGQALLAWWLSPRLKALGAAFPDLAIEVRSFARAADLDRRDVDLALLWLPRAQVKDDGRTLAFPAETVFPVAAPGLAGRSWRRSLALIDKRADDPHAAGPEWSWDAWLKPAERRAPALVFRDLPGALQSALDGNGAALARSLLVADQVRRGQLVRLGSAEKPSSKLQVARWYEGAPEGTRGVAEWLVREAAGGKPGAAKPSAR
jgi:LysR family glycine cleavage system transcriptional activator